MKLFTVKEHDRNRLLHINPETIVFMVENPDKPDTTEVYLKDDNLVIVEASIPNIYYFIKTSWDSTELDSNT